MPVRALAAILVPVLLSMGCPPAPRDLAEDVEETLDRQKIGDAGVGVDLSADQTPSKTLASKDRCEALCRRVVECDLEVSAEFCARSCKGGLSAFACIESAADCAAAATCVKDSNSHGE